MPTERRISTAIWLITVGGLVLRLSEYTRSGLFAVGDYDEGVYFGGALRLVHGSLPYRDFAFVHPPVILELLAPFGALTGHLSTTSLVAVLRVLTALVGTAAIPLVGRLLRHRGLVPVVVGCLVVAVHADAVKTSQMLLLEPYLDLFVLAGMVLLFDRGEFGRPRRALWGGVLLGVALATKVWAIVPIVVLAVVVWRERERLRRFAIGVVAGALVPCLPFLVIAPGSFVHQVIFAQAVRQGDRTPIWERLEFLTGLYGYGDVHPFLPVVVALGVVAALAFAYPRLWRAERRRPTSFEIAVLVTTVLTIAMLFVPVDFYFHYAAFTTPFLALAIALPLPAAVPGRARVAVAAVAVLAVLGLVVSSVRESSAMNWVSMDVPEFDRAIPAGVCVVSDNPAVALAVDRFSADRNCPVVVDPFGTNLVLAGAGTGMFARTAPKVRRLWHRVVRRADVVLLSRTTLRLIPWRVPDGVRTYVRANFRQVPLTQDSDFLLYVRRDEGR